MQDHPPQAPSHPCSSPALLNLGVSCVQLCLAQTTLTFSFPPAEWRIHIFISQRPAESWEGIRGKNPKHSRSLLQSCLTGLCIDEFSVYLPDLGCTHPATKIQAFFSSLALWVFTGAFLGSDSLVIPGIPGLDSLGGGR